MRVSQQKITPADCDVYNHMNTLKYMHKFYEAADEYMLKFGITDPILASKGIGCAYLEFNTKFLSEVLVGEEIAIDISIQEKSSKVVTMLLKMARVSTGKTASEAVLKYLFFDLTTRKSLKLTDEKIKDLKLIL